jgi:hypothetical protein
LKVRYTEIEWNSAKGCETELIYRIADGRALGAEVIALELIGTGDSAKFNNTSRRVLKRLKKQGIIQFFLLSDETDEKKTEVAYLKNKYPDIKSFEDGDKTTLFIKL